jgi:hypothetical protein
MKLTASDCTAHGPLILEFVRGNLSEADGFRAERILTDCPDCQAWIDTQFSGPAFDAVDQAVGTGLESAALSNRRHRFGWAAAAAAIVMVAGGLAMMQLPNHTTPMAIDQQSQDHSGQIVTFDFEAGSIGSATQAIEEVLVTVEAVETDPLFSDNLEDGGTGSWTFHT